MRTEAKAIPDACDVAVIGSGAGGLTAAGLLARAGLSTVVFEADTQPGGYMAGFSRKGFHFDSSVHWLNQMAPGELVHNLWQLLGDNLPECKPMTRIHRYKGDTYDYTLTSNPLDLRDQLIQDFPGDEEGIRRLFEDARKLSKRLKKVSQIRSRKVTSRLEKIWRTLKLAYWGTPILTYIRTPIEDGLRRYFKSPELRAVFCSQESLMPVIVPICWAFDASFQTPPRGGCPTLVSWLCDRLEAFGGKLFLRSKVDKIIVKNGQATGIRLADGREITAKHVVAACDTHLLYHSLFPDDVASNTFMEALDKAELYPSSFSIFLGLDCSPAEFGLGEEVLNLTTPNANRGDHLSGDPNKSIIMMIAPSVRDPSMAPEGKGTMMIHCPAWFDYEDHWRTEPDFVRTQPYETLKGEFAQTVIARVERDVAPGLSDHIEVMSTATPITYWRYTLNEKGTIMGTKPSRHNIKNNLSTHATPVSNVWIGGHGAEVGGGIPMAVNAGANACLAILKAIDHDHYDELKNTMDFF